MTERLAYLLAVGWCWFWTGHDTVLDISPSCLRLQCVNCPYVGPGWAVGHV